MMQREDHGQQQHGQRHVCGRSGHGDDQPLPARMVQKLACIPGASARGTLFLHLDRVDSGHLHVAAQRQG
jgi:hypothetical protein